MINFVIGICAGFLLGVFWFGANEENRREKENEDYRK